MVVFSLGCEEKAVTSTTILALPVCMEDITAHTQKSKHWYDSKDTAPSVLKPQTYPRWVPLRPKPVEYSSKQSDDGRSIAPPVSSPRTYSKFVPLRPKPVACSKTATSASSLTSTYLRPKNLPSRKKCPVPICKRLDCRLQTHHNYRRVLSVYASQVQEAARVSRSPSPRCRADISGLEELPLGHKPPSIYRAMFQQFFVSEYDRIVLLLQPPPLSREQRLKASLTKKDLLAQALQKPVFCLNYVATAYHSCVLRKRKPSNDSTIATLRGNILRLLREWLADFERGDVDHLLLMLVLTLVMLDVATQNYHNLSTHRDGMQHLVNSVGGVHNLAQA